MTAKIEKKLETLITEGERIAELNKTPDYGDEASRERIVSYTSWLMSSRNLFEITNLATFSREFEAIESGRSVPYFKIAMMVGILRTALDEMRGGYISTVKQLINAELSESLVEQAKELLKSKHNIPAAVLGRIAIERWLKELAEQNNIDLSKIKKAGPINDELKRLTILTTPKWNLIQGYLAVGNSAAHGKDTEFSENDVEGMLSFIENNCY